MKKTKVDEVAKVNSKNNKSEILDAYKDALEKIKEVEGQIFDPVKEATKVKEQKIVDEFKDATDKGIEVADIMVEIDKNYTEFIDKINNYKEIETAIEVMKNELANLYDIQLEANSLVALINAQKSEKEKFNAELKAQKSEFEEFLKAEKDKLELDRIKTKEELKELKDTFKKVSGREEAEWNYGFERMKKEKNDELKDEIKAHNKLMTERENKVDLREKAVAGLEEKMAELEKKHEQDLETKVADAIGKTNTSNEHHVRYIKRDYEAKIERLEDRIETLLGTIETNNTTITDLKAELTNANARVESIATKSVESANASKYFETLKDLNKGKNEK